MILFLYLAIVGPHLECCIHFWHLQCNTDRDIQEQVLWQATKMAGWDGAQEVGGEAEGVGFGQPEEEKT